MTADTPATAAPLDAPNDALEMVEATYLALLTRPLDGWRIKNQRIYCMLRTAIAEATGRSDEDVQDEFEALAALDRAEGRA